MERQQSSHWIKQMTCHGSLLSSFVESIDLITCMLAMLFELAPAIRTSADDQFSTN
jgi:hypothetical protein